MAAFPIGTYKGVPQNFFARFAVGLVLKNRYIVGFFRGYRKTANKKGESFFARKWLEES